jgi:Ran GTPase-activating protein (RanGAP) involved in mRNA processing and transport
MSSFLSSVENKNQYDYAKENLLLTVWNFDEEKEKNLPSEILYMVLQCLGVDAKLIYNIRLTCMANRSWKHDEMYEFKVTWIYKNVELLGPGKSICKKLRDRSLIKLDLSWKKVGNTGVQRVCEMLKINTTIQELSLGANDITHAGVEYLGEALKFNTTLKTLVLDNNKITSAGLEHLSKVLQSNTTLQALYLGNNGICSACAEYIGKVLLSNNTLQVLDFRHNIITDIGVEYFINALKTNNSLHTLYLHRNLLSTNIVSRLNQIQRHKRDGTNGFQKVNFMQLRAW